MFLPASSLPAIFAPQLVIELLRDALPETDTSMKHLHQCSWVALKQRCPLASIFAIFAFKPMPETLGIAKWSLAQALSWSNVA